MLFHTGKSRFDIDYIQREGEEMSLLFFDYELKGHGRNKTMTF